MCFDADSRPPIVPIAGGALDSARLTLTADDGAAVRRVRRARHRAERGRDHRPARRPRPAPVLRGAGAALRRARDRRRRHRLLRADRRGRAASGWLRLPAPRGADDVGRPRRGHRGRGGPPAVGGGWRRAIGVHDRVLHGRANVVPGRRPWAWTWPASSASTAGRSVPRGTTRPPRPSGGGDGGAGAGHLRRRRPGHPAVVDRRVRGGPGRRRRRPPDRHVPGAPHSFFDRKSTEFGAASDAAWEETLAFIRAQTAAPD